MPIIKQIDDIPVIDKGFHVYTGDGEKCKWYCQLFCFFNNHRWSYPGGYCECCGMSDELFKGIIQKEFKRVKDESR